MRILIVGAGALGQALGCILASSGTQVDLILRPRFVKPIREKGLKVKGVLGEFSVSPGKIGLYTDEKELLDKTYDYVVITTKSYDTHAAALQLRNFKHQDFVVVSMQNGCGNMEILEQIFDPDRSLGARVITGFAISESGEVEITVTADAVHIGGHQEGIVPEAAKQIAEVINSSGLPCETTPFIKRDLFAKLLYNCALNPLGAILGVHYGALADSEHTRRIMDQVIDETFAVIRAMGAKTHWQQPSQYVKLFYAKLVPVTYNHRPSMLQDLENGKKTEVEALTGYVVNQGRKYAVPTPVSDMLSEMVRFKERCS